MRSHNDLDRFPRIPAYQTAPDHHPAGMQVNFPANPATAQPHNPVNRVPGPERGRSPREESRGGVRFDGEQGRLHKAETLDVVMLPSSRIVEV